MAEIIENKMDHHNVPSMAKANAGLTLGIIGTALGALNGMAVALALDYFQDYSVVDVQVLAAKTRASQMKNSTLKDHRLLNTSLLQSSIMKD